MYIFSENPGQLQLEEEFKNGISQLNVFQKWHIHSTDADNFWNNHRTKLLTSNRPLKWKVIYIQATQLNKTLDTN